MTPAVACERIREGARDAVAKASTLKPFLPTLPLDLEVDFVNSGCADAAELVPHTFRVGGATCRFRAIDAATLVQVIQAWTLLASTTLV